jgi:hypothetical protein
MAIENLKHLSVIFGYLLENQVWKSDDFSIYDLVFFFGYSFIGKGEVGVWM